MDSSGDLFIADTGNNAIREVNASNARHRHRGRKWRQGCGGDNGPASAAELVEPSGVALDGTGDLFVADTGDWRIREIAITGTVPVTVAPATLTVTANAGRAYGAADAAFTASYSGFVLGQTLGNSGVSGSPAFTSNDHSNSPAGSYTITTALGPGPRKYAFTAANGTLTVRQSGAHGDGQRCNPHIRCYPTGPRRAQRVRGDSGRHWVHRQGQRGTQPCEQRQSCQPRRHVRDYVGSRQSGCAELCIQLCPGHAEHYTSRYDGPALTASAASIVYGQTETLAATVARPGARPPAAPSRSMTAPAPGRDQPHGHNRGDYNRPARGRLAPIRRSLYQFQRNCLGSTSLTVGPAAIITTVAGNGTWGYGGNNGPATAAELGFP